MPYWKQLEIIYNKKIVLTKIFTTDFMIGYQTAAA